MSRLTLSDVARAVGYSKYTISLALRGDPKIPCATRQRIERVAEQMGYQHNPVVAHLMSELRSMRTQPLQWKLALVNGSTDADAFKRHPTIPTYVAGCEERAHKLGYSFDRFWLHDPTLSGERWISILQARGIRGIVIVGLMQTNQLPDHLGALWQAFPTVVTGVRTRNPALPFCCVDHHNLAICAVERILSLGYRRPGMVLDDVIDALVERRFSTGYMAAQRLLPSRKPIPIFDENAQVASLIPNFRRWFKKHRPDVILTPYNSVFKWLSACGWRVPNDVGVVQLEWRSSSPEIAGMNQHNESVGEAAVDLLVSEIHKNHAGVQEFPRATLIGASWVDGTSVSQQSCLGSELVLPCEVDAGFSTARSMDMPAFKAS